MKKNTIILALLSIGTLVGMILKANPGDLGEELSQANPWFILAAIFVYLFTTFLKMFRWHLLLKSTGYHFKLKKTSLFFLMGLSINSVTPGGVSGEPVRVYFLRRQADVPVGHGIATIFAERFMDITVLITLALLSLLFLFTQDDIVLSQHDLLELMIPLGLVSGLLIFVGYTVTHPLFLDRITNWMLRVLRRFREKSSLEVKIEDWVLKFKSGIQELASSKKHGISYFIMTFIIWGLSTFRIYLLLEAMDEDVSLFAVFLASSVTYIFGVILPGGTGNIAAIAAVFTAVGMDPDLSVAVGVLEVATSLLFSVPAGTAAMTITGFQIEKQAALKQKDNRTENGPIEETATGSGPMDRTGEEPMDGIGDGPKDATGDENGNGTDVGNGGGGGTDLGCDGAKEPEVEDSPSSKNV